MTNPFGPGFSFEPSDPSAPRRVHRGGSFLSAIDTVRQDYSPGARNRGDPASAACHIGFRCVRTPE
jgi:formylglycine-generating enzyme required for sulfatase activity